MEENIYSPKQFGQLVGRCVKTLQRWDREGFLVAHRYANGRRYYRYDQALFVLGTRNTGPEANTQTM
jgi:putative resolvase